MQVYQKIAQAIEAMRNCNAHGNGEWFTRHHDAIDNLVRDHLPSGSGFDAAIRSRTMNKTCLCIHNPENTEIRVMRRRGGRSMVFPIEFAPKDTFKTASMIAVEKFFETRGMKVEAIHQNRDYKIERRGEYATRVTYVED